MLGKVSVRCGILLAPVMAICLHARVARAADTTVVNGQTLATVTSISGTDTVTVDAGGTITKSINWTGNATGAGIVITNNGTISSASATPVPLINANAGVTGTLTINNTGLMENSGTGNIAPVIYEALLPSGATVVVNNSGTIRMAAAVGDTTLHGIPDGAISFNNIGVATSAADFTLTNSGSIIGSVFLGNGPNTLNFTTGSTISGMIIGANANNATLNLSGAGSSFLYGNPEGANPNFTFLGWNGIINANVNSGTWTLLGAIDYRNTAIASGATLQVCTNMALSCATGRDTAKGSPGSSGISVNNFDTVTVAAGGTLTSTGAAINWIGDTTGAGIVITNNGTFRGTSTTPVPLITNNGVRAGTLTINNTGLMENSATGNFAPVIFSTTLTSAATVIINNSGTIREAAGASFAVPGTFPTTAISFMQNSGGVVTSGSPNFTLNNSGAIIGSLSLGSGVNTLNFTTGSTVTGAIFSSALTATLNLSGSGSGFLYGATEGTNPNLSYVGWSGIFTNNINSGTWTLIGSGDYRNTSIASGATLQICTDLSASCATGRETARGTPARNGIVVDVTDNVVIASGGIVTSTGSAIHWFNDATGSGITISNNGTLRGTGADSTALITNDGVARSGTFVINNTGLMENSASSNSGAIISGVGLTSAAAVNISNSGTITNGAAASATVPGTLAPYAIAFAASPSVAGSTAAVAITNSGTINGGILLGSGTNTLTFNTGSTVTGAIVNPSVQGTNVLNLGSDSDGGSGFFYGKIEGSDPNVTFKGWGPFQTLNVTRGAWTLIGGGYYDSLSVSSGAVLNVCAIADPCSNGYDTRHGTPADTGLNPFSGNTLTVSNNGRINITTISNSISYDPQAAPRLAVSGSGSLVYGGSGTSYIAPASVLQNSIEVVGNSTLVNSGTLTGDVLIGPGATLEIGSGGARVNSSNIVLDDGKTGTVNGSITDNGTLVFNRLDDFTFSADLSGNGGIVKKNSNTVTLSGSYTFTGNTVLLGGAINLPSSAKLPETSALNIGAGTFNLNGTSQTVAGLSDGPAGGTGSGNAAAAGSTGTLNLGSGSLTVNQTSSSTFSGTLAGSGTLTINGGDTGAAATTLVLNGDSSSFAGTTQITGGTLQIGSASAPTASLGGTVNVTGGTLEVGDANAPGATLSGSVSVGTGGTLGGHGTISGSVTNAGTTAPGGSIGTLHVGGNYGFASGSLLAQEVAANGSTDLLQADGTVTIANGATIQVLNTDPLSSYGRVTNYTIVTGAGGVSGNFSGIAAAAGFTPILSYSGNAVNLALVRNDISLTTVAATTNQFRVAAAVNAGGGALYTAVAPNADAVVRQSVDLTSGEIHATLLAGQFEDAALTRRAVLNRMRARPDDDAGWSLWGNVTGNWGSMDGDGNAAYARRSGVNITAGADASLDKNWRGGFDGSYSSGELNVAVRASGADLQSGHIGAYAFGRYDAIVLRVGGSYGFGTAKTIRSINFAKFSDTASASQDTNTTQLFGEAGYEFALDTATLEPFAGIAWTHLNDGAFRETGGTAALSGASRDMDDAFSTLGIAAAGQSFNLGGAILTPNLRAGWQHAYTNGLASRSLSFISTGQTFTVLGAPLDADRAVIDVSGALALSGNTEVTLGYTGMLGGHTNDHGVHLMGVLKF